MTDTAVLTIDPAEATRLLAENQSVRIIDVRTGGEFESAHIPGSFNVPLDTLHEHADELARLEHQLLLVCKSGARSDQAKTALAASGSQQLRVLNGGIDAWQAAGGEVAQGDTQKWALDRQVRLVAGSISLAAIAASVVVPQAKWLAGGVAAGLTYSAASNTCAMGNVLAKLPYNRSTTADVSSAMAELRATGVSA